MGLLHSLLFGGMLAGSAVRAADHNRDAKKNSFTMPNGIEYYYDRRGVMKLMNGVRVEARNGAFYNSLTGDLLYSAEKERIAKVQTDRREAIEQAEKDKKKFVVVRDPYFDIPMCLERSTNKYVARISAMKIKKLDKNTLVKEITYKYYKYYWDYKNKPERIPGKMFYGAMFDINSETVITEEEFEDIKMTCLKGGVLSYSNFISEHECIDDSEVRADVQRMINELEEYYHKKK